ncbi:cytochrome c oxidase assembly protein Cox14p [[Candida] railenensis]|uniref:Cytochrome c oxidase assembly protein Cox14p n=1 Tax=[Candida] railenensis TaxID=45579 RepID=A0A9P0W1D6_9ASCO|nr:cytochrome c oxidase assembly protein Cox14p [[Candida] railenensis]
MSKIPFSVRATDVVHRLTVLGLLGFSLAVSGSVGYNVYMNSDYAQMNKNKLKFDKEEVDKIDIAQE